MNAPAGDGEESDEGEIPMYNLEEMRIGSIRESISSMLSPLEMEMYEAWRLEFARWAFDRGRKPYFGKGYSAGSMRNIMSRVEKFAEWKFREDGFTADFSEEDLTAYWKKTSAER